jgi:hypothetical protein
MKATHLSEICNKWDFNELPEAAQRLCREATDPLAESIGIQLKRQIDAGIITEDQATQELARMAEQTAFLRQASCLVGVEYVDVLNPRQSASPDAQEVLLRLDFEEWSVVSNCLESAKQHIMKKAILAKQALNRQENDLVKRIEDVHKVVDDMAKASTEHLPAYKLQTLLDNHLALTHTLVSVTGSVEDAIMEWITRKALE